MGQAVKSIMSLDPVVLDANQTASEAAKRMAEQNIGAIVVQENGKVCGIVTDRDITVRAVARNQSPDSTKLRDICSKDLLTLSPDDDADIAVSMMRDRAIRRIPVVEDSKVVGIVSLGDLAQQRDRESALGQISAAPPNA